MGGYFGNIEGTNIPSDPRKRTKNHARVEITVWFEVPDEALIEAKELSAADSLRHALLEDGFQEQINKQVKEFLEYAKHVEFRVSQ